MASVFPEWMAGLSMQQQSVLLLAARGPDGIAKAHPCKDVVRAYRGTVLKAARFGRALAWGEKADSFMSLDLIAANDSWKRVIDAYFDHVDALPHHYHLHLAHGAQILGEKHPEPQFQAAWRYFYLRCCDDMHVTAETEMEMDQRLGDWGRKHWAAAPKPTIYTASKTSHAYRWRALRDRGWPIISTWIDEAGAGETDCFADLWARCVGEAALASAVLLYREPGEILKGAFVEVGAALANGKQVHAIGCGEFSFVNHLLVTQHDSIEAALAAISANCLVEVV